MAARSHSTKKLLANSLPPPWSRIFKPEKDGKGPFGPWFISASGLFKGNYKNNLSQDAQIHEACPQREIKSNPITEDELDLIIIHQQVELLGMILGTETSNKYEIKNGLGQRIYFAVEESICFNRTFCSTLRSCTLRITDNSGREVITVNRPLRCNSCWCPCYLQELEIQVPPGTVVGYVAQKWDPFQPKFTIQNANKEDILKIVGPCSTCGCFGDVDFEVKTMNEKLTIGKISKYWSGFVNDVFTNADNFGIHVPADLDVTVKAAMIGACFLFDFMFFEHSLAGL
uniref:phospholipid scramblase family member 5 isoform X2 n=1 Tax=Ictidomys tridecemlineatus TaxID=43179 RepID=UPI001A9CEB2A|nr:phospholipid scramblase family member 5 isoform X2 [Ictidomys tridecemlineatus]